MYTLLKKINKKNQKKKTKKLNRQEKIKNQKNHVRLFSSALPLDFKKKEAQNSKNLRNIYKKHGQAEISKETKRNLLFINRLSSQNMKK